MQNLFDYTKAYLQQKNKLPSLATMTAEQARAMRAQAPKPQRRITNNVTIEQRLITVRDGATIAVRIYTPVGQAPFNIIVYYHGGGWVLNDLETCHESCAQLAEQTNQIVVSVAYRLAPEYRFPIPVYDAFDSFLWVKDYAKSLQGYEAKIAVAGDSAGGNLAAAVCQLAAAQQIPISAQILLYPVTNLSFDSNSYTLFEKGFGLDKDVMMWFSDYYLSSKEDMKNPLAAPLQAPDFRVFPPTLIFAAENDVLRDEALQFAVKLEGAGVQTKTIVMAGIVHSYFTNNDVFEQDIQQTIAQIDTFLR